MEREVGRRLEGRVDERVEVRVEGGTRGVESELGGRNWTKSQRKTMGGLTRRENLSLWFNLIVCV